MSDPIQQFKCIGVVGAGNMGSMMTLAFAEMGLDVSVWDVSKANVTKLMEGVKRTPTGVYKGSIQGFHDIDEFTKSLSSAKQKLFIFSITHGFPADSVLAQIKHDLKPGDIILDGGNENYRRTERRQRELEPMGVYWIGMGVSGGYQSARRGPSLSPGGDPKAIEIVLPLLEKYAAKDPRTGLPCVTNIGPAGSGHFVKMVHNGIEGGMLSTTCEAWALLHNGLGLSYDAVGDIFEIWNSKGELRNTYLIQTGSEICRRRKTAQGDQKGEGIDPHNGYVLDDVLDKVVQDDDGTEGTPLWTVMDTAARHIAAPTISAGHYLRVASGDREQRLKVAKKLQIPAPKKIPIPAKDQAAFIETLRRAVFASYLASFCQGLELIARGSQDEKWNIDLGKCIQIWRAGCIIQEEYISDLLQPVLTSNVQIMNMKLIDEVAAELRKNYEPLKQVVMKAVEANAYLPAMSASLEYLKYEGGMMLPTKFMEAQMDFFGAHAYDKPGVPNEDPGHVHKGAHHYEWRPA